MQTKKGNAELGEVRKRNILFVEDGQIQVPYMYYSFITDSLIEDAYKKIL